MRKGILCVTLLLLLYSCAKRSTPEGGEKDEIPPKVLSSKPENSSINFDEKKIRITFDEYIKLEKLNSQLVVSPPIDKSNYSIFPQGGASKHIDIEINEPLSDSTTFVFNFGESIKDNNEGNLLPFYKYVFSTGSYVDSLELKGNIYDSYERKQEGYITAMLYPKNESFNDSTIYKEKPLYISSTLDSTFFNFSNLKKGEYVLLALKDYNNNLLFDPLSDKVAFIDSTIIIPTESEFDLKLFKEIPEYKVFKPYQEFSNRVSFGYRGNIDSLKINLLNENIESIITKEEDTDTLNYWFRSFNYDTLRFEVKNKLDFDEFKLAKREYENDTLIISKYSDKFELGDQFSLKTTIPIIDLDNSKITIINKDSTVIPFTTEFNNHKIDFDFEILPSDRYSIEIMPNAIIDFFENTNDTLNYNFTTKKRSDYGNLYLNLSGINFDKLIVELLNLKGEIIRSNFLTSNSDPCTFENILPGDYTIRVINDLNKNNLWDTGDFLKKIKPEPTYHYNDTIKVRANWVIRERL